jgi:hypothetical protein
MFKEIVVRGQLAGCVWLALILLSPIFAFQMLFGFSECCKVIFHPQQLSIC